MSHSESMSCVDSDHLGWNFILGLYRISGKTSKKKVMTQLSERAEKLNMTMLQFLTRTSLWARQQFLQQCNRKRVGVKAEATTKRGGANNNASKYVIVSLDPGDYLPGLLAQVEKFRTL